MILTVYVTEKRSRPTDCQVALSSDLTINCLAYSLDALGRKAAETGYNIVHDPIVAPMPIKAESNFSKCTIEARDGTPTTVFWSGKTENWNGTFIGDRPNCRRDVAPRERMRGRCAATRRCPCRCAPYTDMAHLL